MLLIIIDLKLIFHKHYNDTTSVDSNGNIQFFLFYCFLNDSFDSLFWGEGVMFRYENPSHLFVFLTTVLSINMDPTL